MGRKLGPDGGGSIFGKRFMETGTCFHGETKKRCALTRNDCLTDEYYSTYFQTLEKGDEGCDPNVMKIGRCLDENICAVHYTDCTDMRVINFSVSDESCTIQRDRGPEWNVDDPKFTLFGSCRDSNGQYFCAYSNSDCGDSEDYMTPAQTKDAKINCDCAEVRVAGCIAGEDLAYCALNESDCADSDETISPYSQRLELAKDSANLDCRLCQRVNTKKPTLRPTKYVPPTKPPTKTPTKLPIYLTFAPTELPTNLPAVPKNTGFIVGVTVSGGVVALLVTLGIVYLCLFKRKEKEYDTGVSSPPKNIMVS